MAGEADTRTPMSETLQMYAALRLAGVDAQTRRRTGPPKQDLVVDTTLDAALESRAGDALRAAAARHAAAGVQQGALVAVSGDGAVRALVGADIEVEASLLYLRDGVERRLDDPRAALDALTLHLTAARDALLEGATTLGPDTGGPYDDLVFALPAGAATGYAPRKSSAATERLGEAASSWGTL